MVAIPRLLIAGTHSGVGKTTVTIGLIAALVKRGLTIQPFKVGPDYLDPGYHTAVAGRQSRNLDTWLLNDAAVRGVFQAASAGAQLSVIEGVMGVFDGHGSTSDQGSSAQVAKRLKTPVILVVDASAMARSAAAMAMGYVQFDPEVQIAGVIFNKVSERHFTLLREALHRYTRIPALGYLPNDPELSVPERHLGLVPALEDPTWLNASRRLAETMTRTVDLDRLLGIAQRAPALPDARYLASPPARTTRVARIGVARDQAFHFYYQENLELLEHLGAQIIPFSPLTDQHLPESLDALYLGGGFPEVFAKALAHNVPLRREIKRTIDAGLPTYAECGGLMYLAERLVDQAGHHHAMVGALPGTIRMTQRLQHFGYVTLRPKRNTILARANDPIKGHEFHYSVWDYRVPPQRAAYVAVKPHDARRDEGFADGHLLASYVHVHFLTNIRWARGFVASAQKGR